jgi:hypothetical protein
MSIQLRAVEGVRSSKDSEREAISSETGPEAQDDITAVDVIAVFSVGPFWTFSNPVNVGKALADVALPKHRSPGGPLRDSAHFV